MYLLQLTLKLINKQENLYLISDRKSGLKVNIEFRKKEKYIDIFKKFNNLPTFLVAISLFILNLLKRSEKKFAHSKFTFV